MAGAAAGMLFGFATVLVNPCENFGHVLDLLEKRGADKYRTFLGGGQSQAITGASVDLDNFASEFVFLLQNKPRKISGVLAKLREALQTLPFFGGAKVVWLQNCNFLGEERTASAQAVTETLGEISQELKGFDWQNVRLLISAGKVDKRKVFYKTIDKIGAVEAFAGWSMDDKDWADQAEMYARRSLRELKKEINEEALSELVVNVGPNIRLLSNEIEKLSLYVGERKQINEDDVSTIVTRNKQARAFALGDALGERNLPQLLRKIKTRIFVISP